jgi:hypothetical protein
VEDETPPRPSEPPEPSEPHEHDRAGAESASKRASVFPSIAPPPGPNYRILFALVWVTIQAALIVTAGRRSDGAFGFRMFNESSTIHIALFREVSSPEGSPKRVHVGDGVWTALASDGTRHRVSWYDRVPTPYWIFDQEMHASYGADTQLSRLQSALDDVSGHLSPSDDAETRRLVLDVLVRRNGREPVLHRLTGPERAVPAVPGSDGGP